MPFALWAKQSGHLREIVWFWPINHYIYIRLLNISTLELPGSSGRFKLYTAYGVYLFVNIHVHIALSSAYLFSVDTNLFETNTISFKTNTKYVAYTYTSMRMRFPAFATRTCLLLVVIESSQQFIVVPSCWVTHHSLLLC